MADYGLTGKTALVTGAGRGLGRAIADCLAAQGVTVYGSSRDGKTAQAIAGRYGTIPVVMELGNTPSIRDTVRTMTGKNIAIDLLVNNAGINIPKSAIDVTEEDWDLVFNANLRGAFFLSSELARGWIQNNRLAAIVNVASQAGIVAIEERAAYGASKAGMIHLTKILALEWAAAGIRVNAVAPTFVRTELTESTLSRPEWAAELLSRIPIGRFGEPEDVAGTVAFLLSDAAALVTGHTLVVDGGYTIR
ncbi:MAG TPA: SDR family oxidoreductase [Galbitalea sp.]|jgi:NAD(P)-dependent dehydrogenase (short-subunit alcohol dehydrogenase family)|nr:SDR family oxidoreductase [Galbitalea sp.]